MFYKCKSLAIYCVSPKYSLLPFHPLKKNLCTLRLHFLGVALRIHLIVKHSLLGSPLFPFIAFWDLCAFPNPPCLGGLGVVKAMMVFARRKTRNRLGVFFMGRLKCDVVVVFKFTRVNYVRRAIGCALGASMWMRLCCYALCSICV